MESDAMTNARSFQVIHEKLCYTVNVINEAIVRAVIAHTENTLQKSLRKEVR